MLARNYDNYGEFLAVPNDILAIIFNMIGQEPDGWKSLMSILTVNHAFYVSYFKDLTFAKRINVNINFPAIRCPKIDFGKVRHILFVNHRLGTKKYQKIIDVMTVCNLTTRSPGTLSNLEAITAEQHRLNSAITIAQQDTDRYQLSRGRQVAFVLAAGALLSQALYQTDNLSPIKFLLLLITGVMVGKFSYDDVMLKKEKHQHLSNDYQRRVELLGECVEFIKRTQPRKLVGRLQFFDRCDVISIADISTLPQLREMLRVNLLVDNPDMIEAERVAKEAERVAREAAQKAARLAREAEREAERRDREAAREAEDARQQAALNEAVLRRAHHRREQNVSGVATGLLLFAAVVVLTAIRLETDDEQDDEHADRRTHYRGRQ